MQQKFIKNLYQTLCTLIPCIVLMLPAGIVCYIVIKDVNRQYGLIILSLFLGTFFLGFLIGMYWMFQTIVINEEGIQVKLFKKTLRKIGWNKIEDIAYGGIMRNPAYIIKVKGSKDLNLDSRKKIKKSLLFYGDDSIKHMIEKLKK